MTNKNYPIEEIEDLVKQLVKITELIIEPPQSVDSALIDKLMSAQYETIQCLRAITEQE